MKNKDDDLMRTIRKDKLADDVASLIVNRWGINLCSVNYLRPKGRELLVFASTEPLVLTR